MPKKRDNRHLVGGIAAILAGALFYYIYAPNTLFVQKIDALFGGRPVGISLPRNAVFAFLRNYGLDMLWAYALTAAVLWIVGSDEKWRRPAPYLIAAFMILTETAQALPKVSGTFDPWDIVTELITEWLAFKIIKRRTKYET